MADLKKIEVPPGRYADPSPSPSLSVLELATRKVIVINSDPWFRSVDFGTDANGVRKVLSIPEAKTDKMHKTTVGQVEMTHAEWEAICAHPTAKHLVASGSLSLKGSVRSVTAG